MNNIKAARWLLIVKSEVLLRGLAKAVEDKTTVTSTLCKIEALQMAIDEFERLAIGEDEILDLSKDTWE